LLQDRRETPAAAGREAGPDVRIFTKSRIAEVTRWSLSPGRPRTAVEGRPVTTAECWAALFVDAVLKELANRGCRFDFMSCRWFCAPALLT